MHLSLWNDLKLPCHWNLCVVSIRKVIYSCQWCMEKEISVIKLYDKYEKENSVKCVKYSHKKFKHI